MSEEKEPYAARPGDVARIDELKGQRAELLADLRRVEAEMALAVEEAVQHPAPPKESPAELAQRLHSEIKANYQKLLSRKEELDRLQNEE